MQLHQTRDPSSPNSFEASSAATYSISQSANPSYPHAPSPGRGISRKTPLVPFPNRQPTRSLVTFSNWLDQPTFRPPPSLHCTPSSVCPHCPRLWLLGAFPHHRTPMPHPHPHRPHTSTSFSSTIFRAVILLLMTFYHLGLWKILFSPLSTFDLFLRYLLRVVLTFSLL